MLDSGIDQVCIARLARGGEDERGVGSGVLDQSSSTSYLVLIDEV
jgi:hypothetical protein